MTRSSLLIVFFIVFLLSCGGVPPCATIIQASGSLVVGSVSGGLERTLFPSGDKDFINLSDSLEYGAMVSIGPPGKVFVCANSKIWEVDLGSKEMRFVRKGTMATWDPLTDSIAFWQSDSGKVVDHYLYLAQRTKPESVKKFTRAPKPRFASNGARSDFLSAPVLVGPGRFAVLDENHQVCVIDAFDQTYSCTPHVDCWPQTARGDGRHLICNDINTWKVFEIDLESSEKYEIAGLSGRGLVLIPELNSIVHSVTEGSWFPIPHERTVTRLFNLDNGTECTLEGQFFIFPDQAAWLPQTQDPQ